MKKINDLLYYNPQNLSRIRILYLLMLMHLFIGWIHEAIAFKGVDFFLQKLFISFLLNPSNLTIVFISVSLYIPR